MSIDTIKKAFRKTKQVEFLIQCDFNGLVERIGTADVNFSDRRFAGLVLNNVDVATKFDFHNFRYSISTVRVVRANEDRFQDNERLRKLDGAECSIWVWCEGLDWDDIEEYGCIFKGTFAKEYHDKFKYVFNINDLTKSKFNRVPRQKINTATWANHRTIGGGGSVAGDSGQVVFGTTSFGVPLKCVDTTNYVYLASYGTASCDNDDYTAGTYNVYDKEGSVIAASNYTFSNSVDEEGNPCAIFTFTSDQVASEPLTCSIAMVEDAGGEYTTAGEVIEHPADIAMYLMEKELSFSSSNIHKGSFATMKSYLPGVAFSSIIQRDTYAADYLQRLFYQMQFAMLPKVKGNIGVMSFDNTDIIKDRIIKSHSDLSNIRLSKTPDELICNRLVIKYRYNPSSGNYTRQATIDRFNNDDCKESYYQYQQERTKEIELPDIKTEQDALLSGGRYIELFAFRHDLLKLFMPYHEAFGLWEGDTVLFNLDELPSPRNAGLVSKGVLVEKKFTKKGIDTLFFCLETYYQ